MPAIPPGPEAGLRKTTVAYLVLQGAAVFAWWLMLWRVPATRAWFVAPGWPESTLLAFWLPDLALLAAGSLVAAWMVARRSRRAGAALWLVAGGMIYATLFCVSAALAMGGAWMSVALMTPAAIGSTALSGLNALPADRLFRPADPGSASRNFVRTLAQCAVVWGVTLALFPALLLVIDAHFGMPRITFSGQRPLAIALFASFSALNLWSGYSLATRGEGTPLPLESPRRLVISGPYAWVRNPMATGGLGQGMAVALGFGSWLLVAYVVAGALLWNFALRPPEERDLADRFGAEYEDYRRNVRCWIPMCRPYRGGPRAGQPITVEEASIRGFSV